MQVQFASGWMLLLKDVNEYTRHNAAHRCAHVKLCMSSGLTKWGLGVSAFRDAIEEKKRAGMGACTFRVLKMGLELTRCTWDVPEKIIIKAA